MFLTIQIQMQKMAMGLIVNVKHNLSVNEDLMWSGEVRRLRALYHLFISNPAHIFTAEVYALSMVNVSWIVFCRKFAEVVKKLWICVAEPGGDLRTGGEAGTGGGCISINKRFHVFHL
jgi:hypothetical protein